MNPPVPEPLASILERHYDVNSMTADWLEVMEGDINDSSYPERPALFRRQLAEAILNDTISPEQFKMLTQESFGSQEGVRKRLTGLWKKLYGDVPVSPEAPPEDDEDEEEEEEEEL